MNIRTATLADADTIARNNALMAMETENKELHLPTVQTAVKAAIDDPTKGFYLIAEQNGEIAGNLMVTYEWSDWRNTNIWWIQSVYVAEKHRQKGVYKALYAETKKLAKERGVKIIRLYVEVENTRAQVTYKALGMQQSNYLMFDADV